MFRDLTKSLSQSLVVGSLLCTLCNSYRSNSSCKMSTVVFSFRHMMSGVVEWWLQCSSTNTALGSCGTMNGCSCHSSQLSTQHCTTRWVLASPGRQPLKLCEVVAVIDAVAAWASRKLCQLKFPRGKEYKQMAYLD